MEEIWKPVMGFEGCYEISSDGRVRSVARMVKTRGSGRRLSPSVIRKHSISTRGYPTVILSVQGKIYTKSVHRMIAESFIPKVPGKDQVNHIDGVKTNSKLYNLEWCTNAENATHAFSIGTRVPRGQKVGFPLDGRKAEFLELRLSGMRDAEIAEIFGVHRVTVSRVCTDYYKRKKDEIQSFNEQP